MAIWYLTDDQGQRWKVEADTEAQAIDDFNYSMEQSNEPDYSKEPGPEAPLNDPMANYAQGISDVVRTGVDTYSYGGADPGFGTQDAAETARQRQLTQEARDRLGPVGSFTTDVGASLLPGPGWLNIPERFGQGLRTVGHSISGGVQAGLDAYGHGEGWGDIGEAAVMGTGVTTALGAVTDPIVSMFSKNAARAAAPTEADILARAKQKYKDVADAGGVYQNADLRGLAQELVNMPLVPGIDDRAIALRNRLLKDWKGKDVSPEDFDKIRQWVRKKMNTAEPTDRATGADVVEKFDKFADRTDVVIPPKGGAQGPAQAIPDVNTNLKAARENWARVQRAKEVRGAGAAPRESKGGWLNTFGEGSEKPLRKRFAKVASNIEKGRRGGYTAAEKEGVKSLAEGTTFRNIGEIARKVSPARMFGGGGAAALGVGALFGGPIGMHALAASTVPEAVAFAAKKKTATEAADLEKLILGGKKIEADPKAIAEAKDKLARLAAGATRAGLRQFGGPR